MSCGHYTQIIWKDTTKIGCGTAICSNQRGAIVVCQYKMPGNYKDVNPVSGKKDSSLPKISFD